MTEVEYARWHSLKAQERAAEAILQVRAAEAQAGRWRMEAMNLARKLRA